MTEALQRGVFLDYCSVDSGDLDRTVLADSLPDWQWHDFTAPEATADHIRQAQVVISNKCLLTREALHQAVDLKLVALAATGTNNVDLEAAAELGITVCNIRDYCSESLAQHVITLMLNLLGGQPAYLDRVRAGEWSQSLHFSLHDRPIRQAAGRVFGVIGYGALGQASAAKAEALGMQVKIAERRGKEPRPGRCSFDEVLESSDVISIHCPLTEATRGLISAAELQQMKNDAFLINTARGGIVEEQALADALRNGVIAGAGIDTLTTEPPPANHPLLAEDIPNLLVTPHNAWASQAARQAALDQLARIIQAFARGEPFNIVAA